VSEPLTCIRRTWIVPGRFSREDGGRTPKGEPDWGTIPPVHVVVEGRMDGATDFWIEFEHEKRVLLEARHPGFRQWALDLADALMEAANCQLDALALAQEHFAEEERRVCVLAEEPRFPGGECFWDSDAEKRNFQDDIPAGAHLIWQPWKLDFV